jgi:suppressor of fused
MMVEDETPEALGWNAIDGALSTVYGDMEPKHWGTIIPFCLGGKDPLTGLSAYRDVNDDHVWHFVTYGFSELYQKESEDPELSGFGFEMTFRLVTDDVDMDATWVFNFLQNLARYVFETGRVFGEGHTISLNGPIQVESSTKIEAITFILDPQLGRIDTPNGSVEFLQIFGLTEDELQAIQYWNSQSFVDLVSERNPMLATDLQRDSLLDDEKFAATVANRTAEEGASSGEFITDLFSFKVSMLTRTCTLKLGALVVDDLTRRLCGRIPFGRDFLLAGEQAAVVFVASQSSSWSIEEDTLKLELTTATAHALRALLLPQAGSYKIPGLEKFVIEVERTEITDNEGRITKVIG